MSINVIYSVDVDDNSKNTICAIPSGKDLRKKEVIDFIANEILNVYMGVCHLNMDDCKEIAMNIAHHKYASCCEYEFGMEEIPMFEC